MLSVTGYRPDLACLAGLDGVLDSAGRPRQRVGIPLAHLGLAFVGLAWQRSLSSNSLGGVGEDAAHVARRLAAHLAHG